MSDSMIFSITTSPPPVQAVKPAQTVSTSETAVLRMCYAPRLKHSNLPGTDQA